MKVERESLLSGYRALDLTDDRGFLCGKALADLGVEVIKVEPPGGDTGRGLGPFLGDVAHPENSLYWGAFNAGKKGITLNLNAQQGRELFLRLAQKTDFVLESFPPGYLGQLGLGFAALGKVNPGLVLTSITPFGQTGPNRDRKGSDLVAMALSGVMAVTGEPERPPVRLFSDQSYFMASAYAVLGTLMALHHRQAGGGGQWVDVSIYESAVRLSARAHILWEFQEVVSKRGGTVLPQDMSRALPIWPCRDGYITWALIPSSVGASATKALVAWMEEEGKAGELSSVDWDSLAGLSEVPPSRLAAWEQTFQGFFLGHTKAELTAGGAQRGTWIAPIADVPDVVGNEQLAARGFWAAVEQAPGVGEVSYPGHWFLSSETENWTRCGAPRVGEHNRQVYGDLLGLSPQELTHLEAEGIL